MSGAPTPQTGKGTGTFRRSQAPSHGGSADARPPCKHRDQQLDRTICACGSMHYHCHDCGKQVDPCDHSRVLICTTCKTPVTVHEIPVQFIDPARFVCSFCLGPVAVPTLEPREETRTYDPAIADIGY